MRFFFFALLFVFASVFGDVPPWLYPAPVSSPVKKPKSVVSKRDTVIVVVTDTVFRVDTVVDTLRYLPAQYKYSVRYALASLKIDIANPEWLKHASVSEIVARDTATLRIGSEEVRTLGSFVDQFGNKLPQTDIITAGFTIQVFGDKVSIEYRGKNSLAYFSGNFDSFGVLFATGEITETGFLASFFPFNLFFSSSKKRIIIQIKREVY